MIAPKSVRPGHPDEAHPLVTLAFVLALFGAGMLGWVVIGAIVWVLWIFRAYVLVVSAVMLSAAVVVCAAYLVARGNWRARVLAWLLIVALAGVVAWTVTR